jgi:hypothetical protein
VLGDGRQEDRGSEDFEVAVDLGVEAGAVDDGVARRFECHLFLICHYGLEAVLNLLQAAHVLDLMALRSRVLREGSVIAQTRHPPAGFSSFGRAKSNFLR